MFIKMQTVLANHVAAMAPAALIGVLAGLLAIEFTVRPFDPKPRNLNVGQSSGLQTHGGASRPWAPWRVSAATRAPGCPRCRPCWQEGGRSGPRRSPAGQPACQRLHMAWSL